MPSDLIPGRSNGEVLRITKKIEPGPNWSSRKIIHSVWFLTNNCIYMVQKLMKSFWVAILPIYHQGSGCNVVFHERAMKRGSLSALYIIIRRAQIVSKSGGHVLSTIWQFETKRWPEDQIDLHRRSYFHHLRCEASRRSTSSHVHGVCCIMYTVLHPVGEFIPAPEWFALFPKAPDLHYQLITDMLGLSFDFIMNSLFHWLIIYISSIKIIIFTLFGCQPIIVAEGQTNAEVWIFSF